MVDGLRMARNGDLIVASFETTLQRLPSILTEAERDVVRLYARGHSSEEVAAARGVCRRTLQNQLASVYRKLRVGSRSEMLRVVFRDGGDFDPPHE